MDIGVNGRYKRGMLDSDVNEVLIKFLLKIFSQYYSRFFSDRIADVNLWFVDVNDSYII
jgi:hypothetical protein